jgi:hypothetical protein
MVSVNLNEYFANMISITLVATDDDEWRSECTCGWRDKPWRNKDDAVFGGAVHAREAHPGQRVARPTNSSP